MSHYETLGIPVDATAAQIKAAFRKLASKHHPDREGGDAAKSAAVNDAYACLSDSERRRRYDESGEDKPVGPSPEEQRATEIQSTLLTAMRAALTRDDVEDVGLIALTRGRLEGAIGQAASQLKEITKAIARLERLKTRARRKKPDGDDLVQMLLDGELATMQRAQAAAKDANETMGEALKLLDAYEEDAIAPKITRGNGIRAQIEQELLATMLRQGFGSSPYRP